MRPAAATAALAAAVAIATAPGATAKGGGDLGNVGKEVVATGLTQPIYTAVAPGLDNPIYVVERPGQVRTVDPALGSSVEFLDISGRVSTAGEGGLLSIAFHPNYQSNGLFYAYYTSNASHRIHLDEFQATSDLDADEGSRRRVLSIAHPDNENHQGGTIAFGPDDRLYAATGDGGGAGDPKENGQDKGVLLGKVLRINPRGTGDGDYSVPPGNPFLDKPGRDEIYALGLRNPFRFSFDPPTGRIAIGDVGQQNWEEIDIESEVSLRGANFGWDHFEGDHRFTWGGDNEAPAPPKRTYEPPVHEYSHAQGNVVTGGLVVRDQALGGLAGRYLYADYGSDKLRSFRVRLSGARDDRPIGLSIPDPTSLVAGPDDRVYVTSISTGKLLRLVPEP